MCLYSARQRHPLEVEADERVAFVLGHIFEVDGTEAADILGIEPDASRKRLSRARERLRAALNANCGIVNRPRNCRTVSEHRPCGGWRRDARGE
jgi:predicted DNA-binding protein (UPF0251 family)